MDNKFVKKKKTIKKKALQGFLIHYPKIRNYHSIHD